MKKLFAGVLLTTAGVAGGMLYFLKKKEGFDFWNEDPMMPRSENTLLIMTGSLETPAPLFGEFDIRQNIWPEDSEPWGEAGIDLPTKHADAPELVFWVSDTTDLRIKKIQVPIADILDPSNDYHLNDDSMVIMVETRYMRGQFVLFNIEETADGIQADYVVRVDKKVNEDEYLVLEY